MDLVALAATFVRHLPQLEVSKHAKKLKLDGHFLKDDTKLFSLLLERVAPEARASLMSAENSALFNNAELGTKLRLQILRQMSNGDAGEEAALLSQAFLMDSLLTPLSELKLITNLRNVKKSAIYDPRLNLVHSYDVEFIKQRVADVLGKEAFAQWKRTNSEDCIFSYIPNKPRFVDSLETGQKFFNSWTPAPWQKYEEGEAAPALLPLLEGFFHHFCPCPDSRRALFAWLRDATFGRAEPILCFISIPGIGKNIFVEEIAARLVGHHNYRSAQRGFAKSVFHNNITSCRLFFLDEAVLPAEGRESLKSYHNAFATVERKGEDVHDPERIHASFVLASNSTLAIKLEYNDRKFFVPTLSTEPLKKSFTQAKIDALLGALRDEGQAAIKQLAAFLHGNYREGSSAEFPKTEKFKELCLGSLPHHFRRFILVCQSCSQVSSAAFGKGGKRYEFYELRDHIETYESQYGEELAELELRPNGGWVAHSKVYRGAEEEEVVL